jgi:hypothetical protein
VVKVHASVNSSVTQKRGQQPLPSSSSFLLEIPLLWEGAAASSSFFNQAPLKQKKGVQGYENQKLYRC